MSIDPTMPPQHAELDPNRTRLLRAHLTNEIRRSRPRRRLLAVVAVGALLLTVVAGGYAIGVSPFDRWATEPHLQRTGPRVTVAADAEWALQAWRTQHALCLGLVVDGRAAFAGCGAPVDGAVPHAPARSARDVIGYMGSRSASGTFYATGPTAIYVDRVVVELNDGRLVGAPLHDAPEGLDAAVRFYLARVETDSSVRAVLAYDADGKLLQRLAPFR